MAWREWRRGQRHRGLARIVVDVEVRSDGIEQVEVVK